jgi:DNA-directed RNA polymerase specialized sigma24 family protein
MSGYASGITSDQDPSNSLDELILVEDLGKLRAAIGQLSVDQSKVLMWKYGLDGTPPRSITYIANRMRWPVPEAQKQIGLAIEQLRGAIRD